MSAAESWSIDNRCLSIGVTPDKDGILAVDLLHVHLHDLAGRGRQVLTYEVRPDRQLPVPPVDQDGEADRLRPAQIEQGIKSGPDGPARIEDVIDDDHDASIEIGGHGRGLESARPFEGNVV